MMRKAFPIFVILMLLARLASAAAPSLCTISGTVYNADGTPDANDTIAIFPNPSTQVINGVTITAQAKSVQTDANGNVAAFTLTQGLTVNVTLHNSTAAAITTFVPNSPSAAFGNFITASSSINPVTFCSGPVLFAGLPGSPQVGSTCTVTDATACRITVPVTVGGGSINCQLTWTGSQWFPSGGATVPPGSFPLQAAANFNNYSGININQLDLTVLSPPSSVSTTATCTGTCATTYTYEVTCLSDIGAETLPSATVTATNAAALSSSNNNVVNWSPGFACYGGYNVYGRVGGSLALLATCPAATGCTATSYKDTGAVFAPTTYTITFNNPASPSVAVWDLRSAKGWIDAATNNASAGLTLTATGFTTPVNHDLEIPVFAFPASSGVFTPPGGFSSPINIAAATGISGLWGAVKDIAAAGAIANQTGTITTNGQWATLHFSITPASVSSAVTVVGTSTGTPNGAGTAITFNDPAGTLSGDLEVICVSWGTLGGNFPSYPAFPATFNLLGAAGLGVPGAFLGLPTADVACATNSPNASATGVVPPTINKTGTLQQSVAGAGGGVYEETLLGIQQWSPNSGSAFNGAAAIQVIQFPMPLTVTACIVNWTPFTCSTTFPVFAIKDVTSGNVLCSSGTVTTSAGGSAVTPTSTAVAANDQLNFMTTTNGSGCTVGLASISAVFKE